MKKLFALALCMALVFGLFAGLTTGAEETGREVTLDWQNGSFYTGAAPTVGSANRKFTTIKCNEGDVITFASPTGNWTLWAYAADEDGYITDSGYLELKADKNTPNQAITKTYTVAKIGERTPTTLRLTVAPAFYDEAAGERKDSNISDDMWNQFDLKISVVSNTGYDAAGNFWLNGANYDGAVKAGTESTRRHLIFDCQKGDVLEILNNSSDLWGFWIYGIDANGAVNVNNGTGSWIEIKNQESYLFEVGEFAGKVPEKLLITTFRIQDVGAISTTEWATFDAAVTLYGHVTDASGNVWAPGSKYDAPDDNGPDFSGIQYKSRLYTEIDCQEGEKLVFNLDTEKWNVYLYAANGDNYVTGSGYKTLTDGFEYVVPTGVDTLRLTACPKSDGAISKADRAALDVKVTRPTGDDDKDDEGTLDWKYGKFYNTSAPAGLDATNRKYTTIECKKGDKITFESPTGNWSLWAYAADENGFITGSDYLELKAVKEDALEAISATYTVREINGRVPTILRLTVAPNFIDPTTGKRADSNITDELWAEFDIKITVTPGTGEEEEEEVKPDASGLIWNKGAFYDTPSPNTSLATTRRYTVMEVAEGDVIKFNLPSNKWNIWVYPADEIGAINYFQVKNGQEYTVKAVGGRTPVALRITAIPNPDGSISEAMWKAFDVTISKTAASGGSPVIPENPKTSDFSIALPMVTLISSVALVSGVVVLRKKREI